MLYGVLAAAAAVAIVFGLNSVYGFFSSSSTSTGSQRTVTVGVGTVQSSVSASGNVSVASSASANFSSSGTLTALKAAVGDHVRAGQVLAKIDPTSAKNALQTAEANLEQARSTLVNDETGPTSAQQLSNESSLQNAQTQLTNARQQLATDTQNLATAKKQLATDQALACPALTGSSSAGSGSSASNGASAASNGTSSASGSSGSSNASASAASSSSSQGSAANTGSSSAANTGSSSTANTGSSSTANTGSSSTANTGSSSTANTGSNGGSSANQTGASQATAAGVQGSGAAQETSASTSASGNTEFALLADPTTTTAQTPAPTVATSAASSISATGATLNGTVNPQGFYTYYHFEYGTTPSAGTSTPPVDAGSGSAQVSVSLPLTGLSPNATYYFRLVASNQNGIEKGADESFTTAEPLAPTAATGAATGVTTTSATLSGTVNPNSGDTSYYFEYGTTKSFGSLTPTVDAGSGASATQESALLTGLEPGTTYVYELVATNAFGITHGVMQFFTTSTASTTATGAATNVTSTAATLNGTVNPQGANTTYHFEYGLTAALGRRTASKSAGSSAGSVSVSADLTGLEPGKTYHFRLVSSNVVGTSRGADETFTTATAAEPSVTGVSAGSVGMSTATLSGTVNANSTDTHYYFEYGKMDSYGSKTHALDLGSGSTATQVSAVLNGLEPGTPYVFRLVAANKFGTAFGAKQAFTTATAAKPSVTGASADGVGMSTATLSGTVNPNSTDTHYYFEYGKTDAYGSKTHALDLGSGSTATQVSAALNGLEPGTPYVFRLVAANKFGTAFGAEATFTTATRPGKPTASTPSASSVLTTTATLSGSVDPAGTDTKVYFEYGPTAASDARTAEQDAGAGQGATQVSATLTGLKPDTSYLFRVVAVNRFGTSASPAQVFTTAQRSCATDMTTISDDMQAVRQQEATVKSAELSLAQTQATISEGGTTSSATIAQDKATIAEDEATIATDRTALDETTLRAPVSGTITAVNGSVGETVSGSGSSISQGAANASASSSSQGNAAGSGSSSSSSSSSALFTIDSLDKLEVVSGFAEADATKLAVGEPATITFPALPNTEVAGRLTAVSSISTVVSNVVTYNATITLVNPPAEVKEGMTASVSVITQTRSNVLELPSSAITTTGNTSTVELLANGKTTVTPVTTGLVGSSTTEVLSGLKKGDVVVEPTVSVTASSSSTTGNGAGGLGGGGFGGLGGGGGGVFRGGG
jgi:multidrug efflux pump subunit AcrA (membrane-fusion protein)